MLLENLVKRGYDPLVFRIFTLAGHYRKQLNFSNEALASSDRILKKIKREVLELKYRVGEIAAADATMDHELLDEFRDALFNDLNSPQALAVMWKVIGEKSLLDKDRLAILYYIDQILGLGMEKWHVESDTIPQHVLNLVNERQKARASGNWGRADQLRDELDIRGYIVVDSASGAKVSRK